MANILVVDDEESVRRLLSRMFVRGGYECTLAADAAEARKFIKDRNFELILCDVAMPGESGIDIALEEISKNREVLYDPEVADACLMLFKDKGFKFK